MSDPEIPEADRSESRDTSDPLGALIRHHRAARGATQQTLADAVGVARATVAQWEAGTARPTIRHLDALARALCLSDRAALQLYRLGGQS